MSLVRFKARNHDQQGAAERFATAFLGAQDRDALATVVADPNPLRPTEANDTRAASVDRISREASARIMVAFDALVTMLMYEAAGWTGVIFLIIASVVVGFGGLAWSIWREFRKELPDA